MGRRRRRHGWGPSRATTAAGATRGATSGECGDGVADADEVCDGDDLRGVVCTQLGAEAEGLLACADDCLSFDDCGCGPRCGNGVLERGEECEGLPRTSCQDLGYLYGFLACTEDCRFDTTSCSTRCGNGVIDVDEGEVCDWDQAWLLDGHDCTDFGFVASGSLGCSSDCRTFEISECSASCNGVLEPGEDCDGVPAPAMDCTAFDFEVPGGLACTPDCKVDSSGCAATCGNGIIEATESCEDGNVADGDGCSARCRREPMACGDAIPLGVGAMVSGTLGGEGVEDESSCSAPGSDRIHVLAAPITGTLRVMLWSQTLHPLQAALSIRTDCDDASSVVACTTDGSVFPQSVTAPVVLGQIVYVYVDALSPDSTDIYHLAAVVQ